MLHLGLNGLGFHGAGFNEERNGMGGPCDRSEPQQEKVGRGFEPFQINRLGLNGRFN
jgi:hypothetical protein